MSVHSTIRGYNSGAMILHWTIALAILFQLAVGFAMSRLDVLPDALRFMLFQWHKTIGILILALTLSRIVWRLFNPPPAHAPMHRAERAVAGLVHLLFYALLLLVPLSGWLMVSASPTGIPTLLMLSEALPWPDVPLPAGSAGKATEDAANSVHIWLAYSFVLLIALHVAGALKHSVVDRSPSFSRMLPIGGLHRQSSALIAIPIAVAVAAVFLAGGVAMGRRGGESGAASTTAVAAARTDSGWMIDRTASKIGYEVTFSGKPVTGEIGNWDAAVVFDPGDLANASAELTVDTSSVTIGDAFIRSNLAGADGLDAKAHPTAKVSLTEFQGTADGFVGKGLMTVKDIAVPVVVPFTFAEKDGGAALVKGTAEFDRIALKLGTANDPGGEWLATKVKIGFEMRATRR